MFVSTIGKQSLVIMNEFGINLDELKLDVACIIWIWNFSHKINRYSCNDGA